MRLALPQRYTDRLVHIAPQKNGPPQRCIGSISVQYYAIPTNFHPYISCYAHFNPLFYPPTHLSFLSTLLPRRLFLTRASNHLRLTPL